MPGMTGLACTYIPMYIIILVVIITVITIIISKRDRYPHMSMNIHTIKTNTVTPVLGSPFHTSGWTPHERKYRNFLPSHESQLGARGQDGLTE
jgi:sorbitol-specific phosphotransferase system component IIC